MRPPRLALLGLTTTVVLAACGGEATPSPRPACPTEPPTATSAQAILQDAGLATVTVTGAVEGEFAFELYGDRAPIATANFVALARCGFYDGIWFHRVLAGFVIQAGDPQTRGRTGDFRELGSGGPGYGFEIEPPPNDRRFEPYTVAMANDEVANGSQWFVTLADLDEHLRGVGVYSLFGTVVSGTDVVDAIAAIPVSDPQFGVPLQTVTIEGITISSGPLPSG
jgi:peptidyl-prolyl cis-trans isomerase B (cyclophilin B)